MDAVKTLQLMAWEKNFLSILMGFVLQGISYIEQMKPYKWR